MSANQDKINSLADKAEKILSEVQALKAQPGAENLDFSRLENVLQETDDVNADAQAPSEPSQPEQPSEPEQPAPPVEPTQPEDPTVPVEPTPNPENI